MATALVVYSETPGTLAQENGQRKVFTWLDSKHVRYEKVEAVSDKEQRQNLTEISGVKGGYPQVFIKRGETDIEFVGQFEDLEKLIDNDGLSPDVLEKMPEIKSFSIVFKECIEA
uniref:Uncharacterized protein n=2 Tax=Sar TaxID=2698737 RepID=A0A6S8A147_9STRA|mmetsp:Transcript_10562/g.13240  ORF Transcript_10562/g.13240 Transcript_10562/m.13240 type:complete len:115 (+) Transcript_10562:399-743(+)